mgnify:CR=1 FL=1
MDCGCGLCEHIERAQAVTKLLVLSSEQRKYPMAPWAVKQVLRDNGILEDVCGHGVGHPNSAYLEHFDAGGYLGLGVHGCCWCCERVDAIAATIPTQEE